MNQASPDVLIIGGGIAGASLAYYCAGEKLSVTLLEKDGLASGASGANQGNMSLHTRTAGVFLDLNLECLPMFRTLKEELDYNIGFREVSGLLVTDQSARVEELQERLKALKEKGLHAEILSSDDLRRAEPALSRIIQGGLHCSESARIESPSLVVGFARAARRLGAKIYPRTEALRIRCSVGKVEEVQTSAGTFRAGQVVLAAGAGSAALARTAGIELPLEMHRGELLVTEPTTGIGDRIVNELEATRAVENGLSFDPIRQYEIRLVVSRRASGNCLIGRSSEPLTKNDRSNSWSVLSALSRNGCKFIPLLGHLHTIRAFSGIRSVCSDGLPIIGRAPTPGNLFLSVAHGDKGINTGPVIGKLLASYISTGTEPALLRAFSPARFQKMGA